MGGIIGSVIKFSEVKCYVKILKLCLAHGMCLLSVKLMILSQKMVSMCTWDWSVKALPEDLGKEDLGSSEG